jgi:parvulin-like peptidyl-prolyl isomerase
MPRLVERPLLLAAAGCLALAATAAASGSIVAQVGPHRISEESVRAEIARLRATGDLASALKTMTTDGRRQIVDGMVRDELLAQAAGAAGVTARPEVQEAIARATTLILAQAYERDVLDDADVSEPALRQFFTEHAAEFRAVSRVRARHILLETRAEAEAVRQELAAGADFADVARRRSLDTATRDAGGEIGWVGRGLMVKPFEDALFALGAGEISQVVESGRGFHVIQAEEIEQPAARGFDAMRAAVTDRVRQAHAARVLDRLRNEYPVTVFPDALKALER